MKIPKAQHWGNFRQLELKEIPTCEKGEWHTFFCLPVVIFTCMYLTYICGVSSFRIYNSLSVLSLITCFWSLKFTYIVSLSVKFLGFFSATGKYLWEISRGLPWVQEGWIRCLKTVCVVFQSYVIPVGLCKWEAGTSHGSSSMASSDFASPSEDWLGAYSMTPWRPFTWFIVRPLQEQVSNAEKTCKTNTFDL